MDLQLCKDWMNEQFACGNLLDEDGGQGLRAVVACTYHSFNGADVNPCHLKGPGQQCHAHVPDMRSRMGASSEGGTIDVMLDHIQGGPREIIGTIQTPEESITFLQYMMDHPIFSKSFLEHNAEKAFNERIMVRDMGSLPSNAFMFCLIATRAMWEVYQHKIPRTFTHLVRDGIHPDVAFLMSNFINVWGDGKYHYGRLQDCGHNAISTNRFTMAAVKNFLNHKTKTVSSGTMKDGIYPTQANKCNVFSLFEDKFTPAYGPVDPHAPLLYDLFKAFGEGEVVSLKRLKIIEERMREQA